MRWLVVCLLGGVLALAAACGTKSAPGSPDPPPPAPSPAVSPPTAPPTSPAADRAPDLVAVTRPRRFEGRAPLTVLVDLCGSTEPDGTPLTYAYEWAGEGKRLSSECTARHVYERPTRSRAFFCVWDRHPEHLVCVTREVDVS